MDAPSAPRIVPKRPSSMPPINGRHKKQPRKTTALPARANGTHDEVLGYDITALMRECNISSSNSVTGDAPPAAAELPLLDTTLDLHITTLSSTGQGLATHDSRIYTVPFAYPGDNVRARVTRHVPFTATNPAYSTALPVETLKPGLTHDDNLIRCRYFGHCSGCQFQSLSYTAQLSHKQTIIRRAYTNFSGLNPSLIPEVGETVPSPLQYGYRTKLTPHFDGPKNFRRVKKKAEKPAWDGIPPIGFNTADGRRTVLDVEECPIATETVQRGLKRERARIASNISSYRAGATLLLRESAQRVSRSSYSKAGGDDDNDNETTIFEEADPSAPDILAKTCVINNKGTTTEFIPPFIFRNPANAFFQNNNAILPTFISYIREHILAPATNPAAGKIDNLIDAYCGSGLFTLTLSSLFTHSIGIDISDESIRSANENLTLNQASLHGKDITFLAGSAESLFAAADPDVFRGENTVVVIDPPRKGCDVGFLTQLRAFGPERVVYVSCNVHTQARDVGWILDKGDDDAGGVRYVLESLQGFDFFPQTAHVESVAVLRRRR